MEQLIMMLAALVFQVAMYTISAFFVGLAASVGWHLGKRLTG